jgi:DNA-binding NtrC family response regulator
VRVIAATNQDLSLAVKAGRFREDLFYRLRVLPVSLPPLRERRSDIPILVSHFIERHRIRFGRPPLSLAEEAMMHLWSYDWPGNVRELENLMEQLVILVEGGVIGPDDLPPYILREPAKARGVVPTLSKEGINLKRLISDIEEQLIEQALRLSGGRKRAAARLLGLKRTTLLAKLRRQQPKDETDPGHVPVFSACEEETDEDDSDDGDESLDVE